MLFLQYDVYDNISHHIDNLTSFTDRAYGDMRPF